jgi:hypothetical protein
MTVCFGRSAGTSRLQRSDLCVAGFGRNESLPDRTGLAENFILYQVALGLEFRPHLGAKCIHFVAKCRLLHAEGIEFEAEGSEFSTEGVQLCGNRLFRQFHLLLQSIHSDEYRLEVRCNYVLQELSNLGDYALSHTAIVG